MPFELQSVELVVHEALQPGLMKASAVRVDVEREFSQFVFSFMVEILDLCLVNKFSYTCRTLLSLFLCELRYLFAEICDWSFVLLVICLSFPCTFRMHRSENRSTNCSICLKTWLERRLVVMLTVICIKCVSRVCMCLCLRVRACVRACVRVRACVCVCVCVWTD